MKRGMICMLLFAASAMTHAASFDCTNASTAIERAICSDDQLSELDSQLMLSYKKALTTSANAEFLKSDQRAWLATVRNRCQDAGCLKKAYRDRIARLDSATALLSPSAAKTAPPVVSATDQAKANEVLASSPAPVDVVDSSTAQAVVAPAPMPPPSKVEVNSPMASAKSSLTKATTPTRSEQINDPISEDNEPDSKISDVFSSLLSIMVFGFMIGMYKPAWILRWDSNPTRKKLVAYLFLTGMPIGAIVNFTKTDARKAYEVKVQAETKAKVIETRRQNDSYAGGKELYTYFKVDPGNADSKGYNEQEYTSGQLLSVCNINGRPRGHYGWIEFRTVFIQGLRIKNAPIERLYVFFITDGKPGDEISGMWRGENHRQAVIDNMKRTCD